MGVVALLATSCNKNKETATIQTYNQEFEVVDGEYGIDGEKVYFNPSNNKTYFESGDLLTLFRVDGTGMTYADYVPAETQVDQTTWTPVDEALAEGGDLYAFCPGGSGYVLVDPATQNNNRATFILPSVQYYRENTCPKEGFFMASKLEAGQDAFFFKNICGLLWLKLYSANNRKVTEIQITDGDGKHLSGNVSMYIDKVEPNTLKSLYTNYDPANTSYMNSLAEYISYSGYSVENVGGLSLVCQEPVQVGTTSATATNFYMALRPLALRKGFTVKVLCEGGYEFTMSTTRNNIIGPNTIRKMTALNIK